MNNRQLVGWGDVEDWTKEQLISGEYCSIDGLAVSPYERLPISGIIHIDKFEIPDSLSNLRQFVSDFNEVASSLGIQGINPIKLTDEDFSDTHRELEDMLLSSQGKDSENIRIEPPFILALKALLSTLGKKWAGK